MAFLAALLLLYYSVKVEDVRANLDDFKKAYILLPKKGDNLTDQIPTNYAKLLKKAASKNADDISKGFDELFDGYEGSLDSKSIRLAAE